MKIGFIGTGNMGTALMKGYISAKPGSESLIYAYDTDGEKTKALAAELGINACSEALEVANESDYLLLAVKPNVIGAAIQDIGPTVDWNKKVIISIAAGVSLEYIETELRDLGKTADFKNPPRYKVIRVMPNTPALVGKGMSALSRNSHVPDQEFQEVMELFSAIGKAEEVDEKLMDAVVGVSGSSPAYVYLFIEALADGAVLQGMDRKKAYTFAAQSVLGAAEMVLTTGLHPGELKDMVCSPGGTTIEAVETLEALGFRSAVSAAVRAASEKSKAMRK
ncbi:MAG: pyrroline-5-carboxylate reductase [Eubacteriales bacterium]|nr:pyrroline-5-carboxylate reductase [Eubacteriales bacterium]MDD3349647.1 pyrroline-5-carboxylate reductase [Eubacteriales bacterium]